MQKGFKNQIAWMPDGTPRFMLVTEELTGDILDATKTFGQGIERYCDIPEGNSTVIVPNIDAQFHDNIRNIPALFANIRNRTRGRTDASKHQIELAKDRLSSRFTPDQAGDNTHKLKKQGFQMPLKPD